MPSVEQNAHRRRGPDQALDAHAGFGQAEMQRLVGLAREVAIDAMRSRGRETLQEMMI